MKPTIAVFAALLSLLSVTANAQTAPTFDEHKHAAPHGLVAGNTRYTGLIIDTRGLSVERSMAPKIRRTGNVEVWGSVNVSDDFVLDHGIVAYSRALEEAEKEKRAGSNPLIVEAVGRAGGAYNSDPVLTDDDAKIVEDANRKDHFLDKFNVQFIVDANR